MWRSFAFKHHILGVNYEQTTNYSKPFKCNKNLFKNFTVKNNSDSILCWVHFNKNYKNNA